MKILIDQSVIDQALEALENSETLINGTDDSFGLAGAMDGYYSDCFDLEKNEKLMNQAITALRQAKEQAQQAEPVAGQPLPCPFCGHVGLDFSDGDTYRWGIASCGGCGASCGDIRREYPDEGKWHSEAIAEWNKRASPPPRQPLTDERLELIGHADLTINNIYVFSNYGEEVPEGRTPIYAGYKAAHGIKGEV